MSISSSSSLPVKRFGQLIELKSEFYAAYKSSHSASSPGVRDLLVKYHLRNFSIFHQVLGEKHLLFLYGEYTGSNYDADMLALSAEPRDLAWHVTHDEMQKSVRSDGKPGWCEMECVYYNA